MNRQRAEALLSRVRERVQALHSGPQGAEKGFRVRAQAGGTTAIYLYDQVGGWDGVLAKDVVAALAGITGDVALHVNSPGGDIFEGFAIHNALKNHPGRVTAYVDGMAASAASFIVLAADEIVMEANASLMVHDGWGMTVGNAADHRETAELLDQLSDTIAEMYAARSGQPVASWRERMATDTWLNAEQAVAEGLADRVAGGKTAAAAAARLTPADFDFLGAMSRLAAPAASIRPTGTAPAAEGFAQRLKEALA